MEGTVSLFGFPDTPGRLEVLPRSTAWRGLRATAFLGGGLLLAPAVGLVPPHAPWAMAALGIGGILGIRKWREQFTILSFHGTCPRCGGILTLASGIPLRPVMTVTCEGCNHDSRLTTP
ncbi:MAG: hypothetical protein MUO50_05270, partial [Longimicrobiales bacterium]|nr:hypothetical protein [Longimicrobiales bacterium]